MVTWVKSDNKKRVNESQPEVSKGAYRETPCGERPSGDPVARYKWQSRPCLCLKSLWLIKLPVIPLGQGKWPSAGRPSPPPQYHLDTARAGDLCVGSDVKLNM